MPGQWATRCHRCGATTAVGRLVPVTLQRPGQRLRVAYRCADVAACTARLVSALLRHSLKVAGRRPKLPGEQGATCPDAVAMAVALDRSTLTETTDCFVNVETSGALTAGMTVVDRLGLLGRPANATVGLSVDAARVKRLVVDR